MTDPHPLSAISDGEIDEHDLVELGGHANTVQRTQRKYLAIKNSLITDPATICKYLDMGLRAWPSNLLIAYDNIQFRILDYERKHGGAKGVLLGQRSVDTREVKILNLSSPAAHQAAGIGVQAIQPYLQGEYAELDALGKPKWLLYVAAGRLSLLHTSVINKYTPLDHYRGWRRDGNGFMMSCGKTEFFNSPTNPVIFRWIQDGMKMTRKRPGIEDLWDMVQKDGLRARVVHVFRTLDARRLLFTSETAGMREGWLRAPGRVINTRRSVAAAAPDVRLPDTMHAQALMITAINRSVVEGMEGKRWKVCVPEGPRITATVVQPAPAQVAGG